tara:strand:+ start:575 stop:796 length:222 start_codon:yes stop_codon:yes gene_type:complete
MRNLDEKKIDCPYCGECIDIFIEPIFNDVGQSDSYEETRYIEDCFVCCRPITIIVHQDEEFGSSVTAISENEI